MPILAAPCAISPAEAMPRLAKRLAPYPHAPGWTPPAIADLIARIDDALAERRRG